MPRLGGQQLEVLVRVRVRIRVRVRVLDSAGRLQGGVLTIGDVAAVHGLLLQLH